MMNFSDNYQLDFSQRNPAQNVDELFYKRWSPRSFQKTEIPGEILESIFDAARWSQSAYNEQPWRFLTSTPETFSDFLHLLVEQNQAWAKAASVLGFIVAKKNFIYNGKHNSWASFDCGAAWMGMTLQARKCGLYTHGMAGVKFDEVYDFFGIDKTEYRVICAFTLGVIDKPEKLNENMQSMEKPSSRKVLDDIWQMGSWQIKRKTDE